MIVLYITARASWADKNWNRPPVAATPTAGRLPVAMYSEAPNHCQRLSTARRSVLGVGARRDVRGPGASPWRRDTGDRRGHRMARRVEAVNS